MKPNYNIFHQKSIYVPVLGFLSFLAASCGSYQNTSYYDRDGIYGDSERPSERTAQTTENSNAQGNQYRDYFGSLQSDDTVIMTDVDGYTSAGDSTQAQENQSYGGWGSESETVVVNVYGGNWGYGLWNNYWYGPSWGWGWNSWYGPSWGWGWNSWYGPGWGGWGPYYGYGYAGYYGNHWGHNHHWYRDYANTGGRRGAYANGVNSSSVRNYNNSGRRSYTQSGNTRALYNSGTRTNSNTRTYTTPSRTNSNQGTRTYTPQSNNNVRQQSSTPSRSYSPSSSGGSRGGGSFGGGGGGGSRGGGGGRR